MLIQIAYAAAVMAICLVLSFATKEVVLPAFAKVTKRN